LTTGREPFIKTNSLAGKSLNPGGTLVNKTENDEGVLFDIHFHLLKYLKNYLWRNQIA